MKDENDWHSGEDIHLLAALAALLHDLGKASAAFQNRLKEGLAGHGANTGRNRYRHEWVSLRLFQAFVGQDGDAAWLARLADPKPADVASWTDTQTGRFQRDGLDAPAACVPPFQALAHAPLAQAVGWLILTHHRLPVLPAHKDNGEQDWLGSRSARFSAAFLQSGLLQVQADWNEIVSPGSAQEIKPYWHFPQGLPVALAHWQAQAKRLALRLQALLVRRQGCPSPQPSPTRGEGDGLPSKPLAPCGRGVGERGATWLNEPYVMHLSRLALMLADHHYSSLNREDGRKAQGRVDVPEGCALLANTYKVNGRTLPNQTLDEHLIGVAQGSRRITHALPSLARSLPGLVNHKPLRKRSTDARFAWQNLAADKAASLRAQAAEHGAFIVNMASTGTGKTLANARVMNALADPEQGLRCAFAMGLRTLTLQTGRAFQKLLSLGDEQLAIRVGGSASRALFEHFETRAEATGSASNQALLLEEEEEGSVEFAGDAGLDERHPVLARTLHDPLVKKLLVAPVLVCTIDHLTPATESQRGGRQIAPMLRLLTSDLVLDEPDDFDLADLPALTRLVHWAGLLGSRVLLSSATLAPALVQGLFLAYRAGRMAYQRHRGARPSGAATPPEVACLWLDEFSQQASGCATPEAFQQQHERFAALRHTRLAQEAATPRRRCALVVEDMKSLQTALNEAERAKELAALFQKHALALHELHAQPDPQQPSRRVSFGLIRMANIEPLVQVARALFALAVPAGVQIHLCVYHSQFPLLLRSNIERRLDAALNRREPQAVFALADIRSRLEAHPQATQHLFIVLGSPVTEVGRDHDYDWAIVEPSSMRSLIQLVGRVKRHRVEVCGKAANVRVLDSNLRHLRKPSEPAFCRPGFETAAARLDHHLLRQLLRPEEFGVVDARPRIVCPTPLEPSKRWVDLEHGRLAQAMLPPHQAQASSSVPADEAAWWWWHLPPASALMTALLPQHQPFRDDAQKRVDLCLRPTDDEPERVELTEVVDAKKSSGKRYVSAQSRLKEWPNEDVRAPGICAWAEPSYAHALAELAEEMGVPLQRCAERFGTVSLPASEQGWWWHAALGFVRRE